VRSDWKDAGFRLLAAIAVPAAVLVLWEIAARLHALNVYLLPGPAAVLRAGLDLAHSGELARHVGVSSGRVLIGFALATVTAVPIAVAVQRCRLAERLLRFPLNFMRATAPLALLPLLVLWFGIGEAAKWVVILLAGFFPILLNTIAGLESVPAALLEMGGTLDLTRLERVRFIIVPAALPTFVAGLRLGFGNCWRAVVGAELIGTSVGLGYLIMDAQALARTDVVYAGILVIGSLGYLADQAFVLLTRGVAGDGGGVAQD